jgi:hypothetical protein
MVDGNVREYLPSVDAHDENATRLGFALVGEGDVVRATRHRVAAPVPTKPEDIGAASVDDVTLLAIYPPEPGSPPKGYVLGTQQDKPLQPQGDYAPATALRYDLPADATTIASASQEVVEGETVTYGAATLADRTANRVAITAEIAELRITFPAAISGKVRDFGLRVEVGDGTAALTAPALVPVEPTGETIKLENPDAAIPALADGAADAKGVTLLYFSETSPGVFLVKGEQVKEVA